MRLILATHDHKTLVRKFRRAKTMFVGAVVVAGVTLVGTLPAGAAPITNPSSPASPPSTSGDAKTAWQNSSHLAEIASEQVNGAKEAQVKAQTAAQQATHELTLAKNVAASSQKAATAAAANVTAYQSKIDAFANASFRGANLSQFSVILTAKSADDFLDDSTVVNRVAEDTATTLKDALTAKETAAGAKSVADEAESAAETAKVQADRTAAAATAAIATATSKKAALDTASATYKKLYEKLSAQEKAAAAAAAEKARLESLRLKAEAEAAVAAAAAQAKQAASEAASSSSSSFARASNSAGASSNDNASSSNGNSSSSNDNNATSSSQSPTAAVDSSVASSDGDAAGRQAAAFALSKVGFAYVYAGDGPSSYDCSGLTTAAWASAGIGIPRTSYEQANFPSVPLDQLQPGDLVTYYSPVSHVAIYVGNGNVVSAADESLGIVIRPVSGAGPNPTGHRVPRG